METISCFSVRQINTYGDYERFRNTRTYINNQYDAFMQGRPVEEAHRELMRVAGYSKYDKFTAHLKEFNLLKRNIPLSYLEHIGCSRKVVECAYETDLREYEQALEVTRFPWVGIFHFHYKGYALFHFPEGTPEEEAIQMMISKQGEISATHKKEIYGMWIHFPKLKEIIISTSGEVKVMYYKPLLKFGKKHVLVSCEDDS